MFQNIIETCPKCGGRITEIALCSYPPKYRKICDNCRSVWEKNIDTTKIKFNPDEQGYTEISSGGAT